MSALAAPRAWVMSEMARDDPKPLWRSRPILYPPRSSSILGPSSRRCCTSCARRRWCPSHTHTGLAARPAPTSSLLASAPQPPRHTLHAAHSHRTPTLHPHYTPHPTRALPLAPLRLALHATGMQKFGGGLHTAIDARVTTAAPKRDAPPTAEVASAMLALEGRHGAPRKPSSFTNG